jgi:hypothetical protein
MELGLSTGKLRRPTSRIEAECLEGFSPQILAQSKSKIGPYYRAVVVFDIATGGWPSEGMLDTTNVGKSKTMKNL